MKERKNIRVKMKGRLRVGRGTSKRNGSGVAAKRNTMREGERDAVKNKKSEDEGGDKSGKR